MTDDERYDGDDYDETTRRPIREELERKAAEAYERITRQHFADWLDRAKAVAEARDYCLHLARQRTNARVDVRAQAYRDEHESYAGKRPWLKNLKRPERSQCYWLIDHLAEVEAWRATLTPDRLESLNHPRSVQREYQIDQRAKQRQAQKETGDAPRSETSRRHEVEPPPAMPRTASRNRTTERIGAAGDAAIYGTHEWRKRVFDPLSEAIYGEEGVDPVHADAVARSMAAYSPEVAEDLHAALGKAWAEEFATDPHEIKDLIAEIGKTENIFGDEPPLLTVCVEIENALDEDARSPRQVAMRIAARYGMDGMRRVLETLQSVYDDELERAWSKRS